MLAEDPDYSQTITKLIGYTVTPGHCLVFELMGCSLAKMLDNQKDFKPVAFYLSILADVAHTLCILAQNRILHLDLKPANIVLQNGRAKVIDFGIARLQSDSAKKVEGTSAYLPMETFKEQAELSPKTDIYSFGVVMAEIAFEAYEPRLNFLLNALCQHKDYTNDQITEMASTGKIQKNITDSLKARADNHTGGNDALVALATDCVAVLPKDRPTAETVLSQVTKFLSEEELALRKYSFLASKSSQSKAPMGKDATSSQPAGPKA